ncbi:hypothetical protein ACEQ8H_005820 [Pleosporales sp. CAS-2024a]
MRFFEMLASGAALLSSAVAVTIDTYPSSGVEAGKSYTITYSPKDQPATFILRQGLSSNLNTIATLGQGSGGTFTWTPSASLANLPNYALEIQQGSEINYSGQFGLTGGSNAPISSALSSASAALSSAASVSPASASTTAAPSASVPASSGANSTVASATLSKTTSAHPSKSTSTTTGASAPPQSTGAASMMQSSPLALLFGAVAAFAYLG